VAIEEDGDFVVAWASYDEDGNGDGVFSRSFDVSGTAASAEIQVNQYVSGHQSDPAIGLDGTRMVVVWDGDTQDGSSTGVFAQRFNNLAVLDIDGDGAVDPLTDGLLVLRGEFGFTGATLVTGAVHLTACTRCDAAAIQGYLQTLL
jgi:hypothetical protein